MLRKLRYRVAVKILPEGDRLLWDCYLLNKVPESILAQILDHLPRYMLSIVSNTCRKLRNLAHAINPMLPLSDAEHYKFLECLAHDSLNQWACSQCHRLHQLSYSDGPLKPSSTYCPQDRDRWRLRWKNGSTYSYLCLGPGQVQFALKYAHLLMSPGTGIHEERSQRQARLFHRIMGKIHITDSVHLNHPLHKLHIWFSCSISNGSFYTRSIFKAYKIAKLENLAPGSSLPIPRCCKHEKPGPSTTDNDSDLRERAFRSKFGTTVYEKSEKRWEERDPTFPSFGYEAAKNNAATVVQTALENPGRHYKGDCEPCFVEFGAMTSRSVITFWVTGREVVKP